MNDEVSVDEIKSVVESLGLDLVKDVAVRGKPGIVRLFDYVVEGHGVAAAAIHLSTYFSAGDMTNLFPSNSTKP